MLGRNKYSKWLFTVDTVGLKDEEVIYGINKMMIAMDVYGYVIEFSNNRAIVKCKRSRYDEYKTKFMYHMAYIVLPQYVKSLHESKRAQKESEDDQ